MDRGLGLCPSGVEGQSPRLPYRYRVQQTHPSAHPRSTSARSGLCSGHNHVRQHSALGGRAPAEMSLPTCSPASRPLRVGFADGLRPALTQAPPGGLEREGRGGETALDQTEKHRHDGRVGLRSHLPSRSMSRPQSKRQDAQNQRQKYTYTAGVAPQRPSKISRSAAIGSEDN
jgi:hypothetical protein